MIDLHVHTTHSDGGLTVLQILQRVKDAGIDDLTQLVENCATQPLMNNNPAKLNKEELIELFEGLR